MSLHAVYTARVGAEGDAISFACEDYAFQLPEIEEYIGHKIPSTDIDPKVLFHPKPPGRQPRKPRGHSPRGKSSRSHRRVKRTEMRQS